MNKIIVKACILSVLLNLIFNANLSSQNSYNGNLRQYNIGKNYYKSKNFKQAIIEFDKIINFSTFDIIKICMKAVKENDGQET